MTSYYASDDFEGYREFAFDQIPDLPEVAKMQFHFSIKDESGAEYFDNESLEIFIAALGCQPGRQEE